jgi:uncharacterized Zn finger protein
MGWYGEFAPYVSVAERKRKAAKFVAKLKKKGQVVEPIVLEGRTITQTFWGKAWCKNLESYSDYSNRLPRGRTYVRNGSVIDLKMAKGEITALVSGTSIYKVKIVISKVVAKKWNKIVSECSGKIDSLIELLQGTLSKSVMEIITDPERGLFPHPKEIKLSCSCPDWADMCKHVAAVLYGVGVRLDGNPEELFILRQADHVELIANAGAKSLIKKSTNQNLEGSDLSSLFGIDMIDTAQKDVMSSNKNINVKKAKVTKNINNKIEVKSTRSLKTKAPKKTANKKSIKAKAKNDKSKVETKKILSKNTRKATKRTTTKSQKGLVPSR